MEIREAQQTENDLDIIAGLWQTLWPDTPRSGAEMLTELRSQPADDPRYHWIARSEGQAVGFMIAGPETWERAPGRFEVFAALLPEFQGRGWGKRLYAEGLAHLTGAHEVSMLYCSTRDDMPRGVRFLEDQGFELYKTTCLTQFRVAAYQENVQGRHLQRALADGTRIVTMRELMNAEDDWFSRFHYMVKECKSDLFYPPTEVTLKEHWRQFNEDQLYDPDVSFVAVCDGEYAAYTSLYQSPSDPGLYWTTLTGTRRNYRRRGLATALKAKAVETVRSLGGTRIRTDNDPRNPMYRINVDFGFESLPDLMTYRKSV